jgi:hypothetical protein
VIAFHPRTARNTHSDKQRSGRSESLADRLEELAFRLLDSITDDKIRATPLLPLMKTLALAVDIMLLLQRQECRGRGDRVKVKGRPR